MKRSKDWTKAKPIPDKRANWTKEETKLLVSKTNQGEAPSTIQKSFPQYKLKQIHSKLSSLKKAGTIKKIPMEGIEPSLQEGKFRFLIIVTD
jgi:hypothetical protein